MTRQTDIDILRDTIATEFKTGYASGARDALTSFAVALDAVASMSDPAIAKVYREAARMARESRDADKKDRTIT